MVDSSVSIEELSASLVREYLARKGLKDTLAKLDGELPRTSESISNRVALAKAVHIEKLMKKNKEDATPYRTMVEVIVKFLTTSTSRKSSTISYAATPTKVSSTEEGVADSTPLHVSGHGQSVGPAREVNVTDPGALLDTTPPSPGGKPITLIKPLAPASVPPTYATTSARSRFDDSALHQSSLDGAGKIGQKRQSSLSSSKHERKIMIVKPQKSDNFRTPVSGGMVTSGLRLSRRDNQSDGKPHSSVKPTNNELLSNEERPSSVTRDSERGLSMFGDVIADSEKEYKVKGNETVTDVASDDLLLCEDLEDIDVGASLSLAAPLTQSVKLLSNVTGKPIDLATAKALRELVFGTATGPSFNAEWRRQNFEFCDVADLEYGLIQHKGGPCGVLACVQAYILKHMIFTGSKKEKSGSLQPTDQERTSSLVAALADILWKAGQQKSAIIALSGNTMGAQSSSTKGIFPNSHYKPDKITETLILYQFTNFRVLRDFLHCQLSLFQDVSSNGCILLLYSLILSKGIDNIKSDMDNADTALLGAHGYCTQEIVNLMLTGHAVSNVFNGTQQLDSGGKNKHVLRGPPTRSEVGLLSLFEHYGLCSVGSNLKDPIYPIWVVSSESHFTVLFCHRDSIPSINTVTGDKVDLTYYDGLANQDAPILLTIDKDDGNSRPSICDNELEPPLELVIKTKWRFARISWNGTEPLL